MNDAAKDLAKELNALSGNLPSLTRNLIDIANLIRTCPAATFLEMSGAASAELVVASDTLVSRLVDHAVAVKAIGDTIRAREQRLIDAVRNNHAQMN